jgi:hypothetical protein
MVLILQFIAAEVVNGAVEKETSYVADRGFARFDYTDTPEKSRLLF